MPDFWYITELVHMVVLYLSQSDQASLARVNRRLWAIAVTEIWSSVPDFRNFFLLLPTDLCIWDFRAEANYPSILLRPIRASDFDRLILYSQFTKTLYHKGSARQAILSQASLRRLKIFSFDDVTALAYTAKELPWLTHFDVGRLHSAPGSPSTHEDDEGASERWFRSLVTLRASGSPAGVHSFMENIASVGLAEIKMEIEVSWQEPMRTDALLAVHAFKATLVDLEVQIRGEFAWSYLEPILHLDQLQKFSLIYTPSTISPQVNDAQLLQMTRAWPRLASLRVHDVYKTPTITLQGLGYIASNSRNLRSLFVTFDGTSQVDPSYLPGDDSSSAQNSMELVDVLWSKYDPGDELRITTSFFRRWWPRARIMASDMPQEEAKRWKEASAASRTT
ncbi:hypothetical protein FS837_004264 [Tulasnella sp. UAMH 9824]|nr:hypothetical protein FS837_004264 [Tulasnella sp. UAMH 9824]